MTTRDLIVGATIEDITVEAYEHGPLEGERIAIRTKDGERITLIVSCDPEGNGPGYLHLAEHRVPA